MAIFEAEAIRALEFFHQVFGVSSRAPASLREGRGGRPSPIAGGRQNGLFFHTSPRKDSESLYLSLCFLEALSRLVFPRLQSLRPPDLGFSLDAVHITFGHEAARLPFLWAFDIAWIEGASRGMTGRSAVCPDQAPFYGVFFLGTLQCGALMARHHPTADMLDDAVASVVQEISRHGAEPGGADLAALTENLFRSEVAGGGEAWSEPEEALYRRAFQLGVDLVAAGMAGECPPEDQFFPRLAALKADVWGGLFESGPRSEGPLRREEDTAIHAVLTGLMARWRRASGPAEYPRPGADGSAAGVGIDVPPTVVLGAAPPAEEEALMDTVVLEAMSSTEGDDLLETMALSAKVPPEGEDPGRTAAPGGGEGGRFGPAGGAPAAASDDVPETVVLYPGGSSRMAPRAGRPEATEPLPPPPAADDDLPETVVAGKAGVPPGKKPPEAEPEAEDDIAFETVIIRPGGRNDHHRGE